MLFKNSSRKWTRFKDCVLHWLVNFQFRSQIPIFLPITWGFLNEMSIHMYKCNYLRIRTNSSNSLANLNILKVLIVHQSWNRSTHQLCPSGISHPLYVLHIKWQYNWNIVESDLCTITPNFLRRKCKINISCVFSFRKKKYIYDVIQFDEAS
jgi:hypothetical protein